MNAINGIGHMVVETVFEIAGFLLLLRLLLQLFRADFYNPVSQSVVRITAFLDPLRRVLGARGGLDFATLLALVALKAAQYALLSKLAGSAMPGVIGLLAVSGYLLLDTLLAFFFWAVIIAVVISWLAPDGRNPMAQLLWSLTEPLMAPARRLLPPLGGLDFSPVIVLLLLNILRSYGLPALGDLLRPLM